ncbi:MAG: DUF1622 domain-containing protein [Dehalococcoidia bacterium]
MTALSGAAHGWIEAATLGIELLAVAIIVGTIVFSTGRYLLGPHSERYNRYKTTLGKALLLGLEILVAADVVRTVALDPSIESVAVLGLLVLVRTFLSWSLIVEMEGRWPWQQRVPPRE